MSDLTINYVRASKFNDNFDPNIIRVKLDRDIPCGIYTTTSIYGSAIISINQSDSKIGYLYMKNIQKIMENVNMVDLWNLIRNNGKDNIFIQTFNNGCCK